MTNNPAAMFLEDVSPETPLDELAGEYAAWRRRQGLDTEQAGLGGWSR